jgi:predicted kinase
VSRLVITRGLPGCGKTTRARHWVAEDPLTRCRVNRDDLRLMFYATRFTGLAERERAVTVVQYPAIRALLKAGFDVVSDDTWLREDLFQTLRSLAIRAGAIVEVWDMRNVPLDVCI